MVVRRPLDGVDAALVVGILVDLAPLPSSFLPDEDSPVVAAGGEDVAEPGVSPGHLPHGALVALQVGRPGLLTIADVKYLDGPGGR